MTRGVRVLLLGALVTSALTLLLGWWGPALGAAGLQSGARGSLRSWVVGAAAASGWLALLTWNLVAGDAALVARTLGTIVPVTGPGWVALTLGFAALQGWTAARLVAAVRGSRMRDGGAR